jgi:hypothetical protein
MKTITAILMMLLLGATGVLADEVDEGLSEQASVQLRTNTREMIRLGIHQDEALEMVQLMERNRFRNEMMLRAQNVVMQAKQEGLPVDPVMSKAREGMAKQVRDQAVVQAMEQVRSRYSFAYEQAKKISLDSQQRSRLGDTLAQGLAAGMAEKDIEAVREQLQIRTRQMTRNRAEDLSLETCNTVRTMARLGVRSGLVEEVVREALQNNFQAREMKTLRHSFMQQSRKADPAKLAQSYTHGIRGGMNAESLGSVEKGGVGRGGAGAGTGGPGGSAGGSGGSGGGGSGGSGGGGK